MRVLAIILLLGVIGAGTVFILGPRADADASAEASGGGFLQELGDRALAMLDGAGGEGEDAKGSAPSRSGGSQPSYYQYTDERGTVHFVTNLELVPARFRDNVGQVDMKPVARSEKRATRRTPSRRSREPAVATRANHEVVVYTTTWCGWCRKTLAFLDEQGVDYVNKDIEANDHNRDELIRKTGRTSIPVVEIDGELIRGYDQGRMEALLGL